jgi:hypothetical protein
MSEQFRREAAVLAAYLAQFANPDTDDTSQARLHDDYLQATRWATAAEPSSDDITALAELRLHHGFPAAR